MKRHTAHSSSIPLPNLALASLLLMTVNAGAAPTESQVLATLSQTGVRTTLTELRVTGTDLEQRVGAFCDHPNAGTLEHARDAWRSAYAAWRRAEPFLFGPLRTLDLRKRIGVWPTNETVLDGAVNAPDLGHLLRSADTRGYAAAEYLLFAPNDPVTAASERRCAHLRDLTHEITELTAQAVSTWGRDYEQRFLSAGDGAPFLTPGDALSLPIAEALNVTERLLRDRIGPPSGFFEEPAQPERLEARRSGNSREGLRATLEGLRLMVMGDGETGVAALVGTRNGVLSTKDPKLAAELDRRLAKAIDVLGEEARPLHEALRDEPKRLKRLYREVERLQADLVQVTLVLELDVLPSI